MHFHYYQVSIATHPSEQIVVGIFHRYIKENIYCQIWHVSSNHTVHAFLSQFTEFSESLLRKTQLARSLLSGYFVCLKFIGCKGNLKYSGDTFEFSCNTQKMTMLISLYFLNLQISMIEKSVTSIIIQNTMNNVKLL